MSGTSGKPKRYLNWVAVLALGFIGFGAISLFVDPSWSDPKVNTIAAIGNLGFALLFLNHLFGWNIVKQGSTS